MPRLAGPLLAGLLAASVAPAQTPTPAALEAVAEPSFVAGTVTDAATGKPLVDVVVTISSPSLPEEKVFLVDPDGRFRVDVPEGAFDFRFEVEDHRPYSRGGIQVRAGMTTRINVRLLPEPWDTEREFIGCRLGPIDTGSNQTGISVGSDFWTRVPLFPPH